MSSSSHWQNRSPEAASQLRLRSAPSESRSSTAHEPHIIAPKRLHVRRDLVDGFARAVGDDDEFFIRVGLRAIRRNTALEHPPTRWIARRNEKAADLFLVIPSEVEGSPKSSRSPRTLCAAAEISRRHRRPT